MNIKILSSISGRIRVRIDVLLHNENAIYFYRKSLQFYHGIISVYPSSVTGNILVYYDAELVDTIQVLNWIDSINICDIPQYISKVYDNEINESKIFSKECIIKNFLNKYPIKIYTNEFALSRRLLTLSVIMSGLSLHFYSNLTIILSIMFFGFPVILFIIRRSVYSIAQKKLKYNEFYFNDPNLIHELAEAQHLLIEDSILNYEGDNCNPKKFTDLPYDNALYLIKDFRNIGLTDISMVSRKNNYFNNYISYMFSINKIEIDSNFSNDEIFSKILYNKDKNVAIVLSKDLSALSKEQIVVFLGYKQLNLEVNDFIITFRLDVIDKIPYVIEYSKYCNKLAIISENIAITVNTIGIFLAVAKFITPLLSILIYILNYIESIIYLNIKLSQHEKEHLNEIQHSRYNTT